MKPDATTTNEAPSDETEERPAPTPLPVTAVTITAPSTTVDSGQTVQLTATARNANGAVVEGRTFEWTTVDAAVASVSASGLVTGLKPGPVEIRASTESVTGSILITFMPAGKMEAFFREVTKANAMPPQDPALWRAHGMELLGPPLSIT